MEFIIFIIHLFNRMIKISIGWVFVALSKTLGVRFLSCRTRVIRYPEAIDSTAGRGDMHQIDKRAASEIRFTLDRH